MLSCFTALLESAGRVGNETSPIVAVLGSREIRALLKMLKIEPALAFHYTGYFD